MTFLLRKAAMPLVIAALFVALIFSARHARSLERAASAERLALEGDLALCVQASRRQSAAIDSLRVGGARQAARLQAQAYTARAAREAAAEAADSALAAVVPVACDSAAAWAAEAAAEITIHWEAR